MSEKPILFSGAMVRAILDERKTQTRRVIKPQPTERYKSVAGNPVFHFDGGKKMRSFVGTPEKVAETLPPICPYGKTGDHLWVRETWAPHDALTLTNQKQSEIFYRADGEFPDDGSWRPSIHLPRWACRLRLKIVTIRVERLRDITRAGVIAEGCPKEVADAHDSCQWYRDLWDSINAKRGYAWETNPWVWIIEFRRIK